MNDGVSSFVYSSSYSAVYNVADDRARMPMRRRETTGRVGDLEHRDFASVALERREWPAQDRPHLCFVIGRLTWRRNARLAAVTRGQDVEQRKIARDS